MRVGLSKTVMFAFDLKYDFLLFINYVLSLQ